MFHKPHRSSTSYGSEGHLLIGFSLLLTSIRYSSQSLMVLFEPKVQREICSKGKESKGCGDNTIIQTQTIGDSNKGSYYVLKVVSDSRL